ncbi:MAG: biotin--[acetyl-CoA-carboxylase] ligase [Thermoguttaceae bacterium]
MYDLDRILRETFLARAEYLECVDSTNRRATEVALEGGPLPFLIAAQRQTAGRGRGAHRWWTGPGALVFSLAVAAETIGVERSRAPLASLAVGVAVADAVAPWLPSGAVALRWPNDVLAAGRKLSGILIEVLSNRRHVIGIGVNTNNTMADAPMELQSVATTLRDRTGRRYDPTETLLVVLNRLDRVFADLRNHPETVAARADVLCWQRGRRLAYRQGDRLIEGRCAGIASDGALLLETSSGVTPIYTGTPVDFES